MLNSDDLQQLKIQALLEHSTSNYAVKSFPDISNAFPPSSVDHAIIASNSNANIMAFCYVLLAHIFDTHSSTNSSSSSNASPSSQSNSGSGSKSPEKMLANNSKSKDKQQTNEGKNKLNRIYTFLLSPKINMSQISNIPENLQRLLISVLKLNNESFKKSLNVYLKKLLLEFLKMLKQCCQLSPRPNSKTSQKNVKESFIAKTLQKYSICQILMPVFIRSLLYFEYEIAEAIDYNRQISDQTVFTALCDAFDYSNLKMQQNYTEISSGSYIRFLRKKAHQNVNFYLISLPQIKWQNLASKDLQQIDTFRIRRKSSDQISNNESVSFRQNSRQQTQKANFYQKNKQEIQTPKQVQKLKDANNKKGIQQKQQLERFNNAFLASSQLTQKKSKNTQFAYKQQNKFQKSFSDKAIIIKEQKAKIKTLPTELNGYTSIELLQYLNPNVRESMMKTINHYKQLHI